MLFKVFLFTLFILSVLANEDEKQKNKEENTGDKDSLAVEGIDFKNNLEQNIRQSRQNGLFLQSTVDNKEYLVFQPQSLKPLLKLIRQQNPQPPQQNDEENSGDDSEGAGDEASYEIENANDGIEVPLTPEDHLTSESEPSESVGNEEGEPSSSLEHETGNVSVQQQIDYAIVNKLREIARLEYDLKLRYEALRRQELALHKAQLDIWHRENLLARREKLQQKDDYETDKLLQYRLQTRRQNLNAAKIFRILANNSNNRNGN